MAFCKSYKQRNDRLFDLLIFRCVLLSSTSLVNWKVFQEVTQDIFYKGIVLSRITKQEQQLVIVKENLIQDSN